jgi:hypothetical protein
MKVELTYNDHCQDSCSVILYVCSLSIVIFYALDFLFVVLYWTLDYYHGGWTQFVNPHFFFLQPFPK